MYSILLVDDETIELEMLRDYIRWEEMGIYVAGTAVNGKDALEKIEVIQPDIVLTDVQMPLMNGIELAKRVRERYDWMQLVFLTGHDEFAYVKSALNVGAIGYLLKPLDLTEIVAVMERVKQNCEEVALKNRSIQVAKANVFKELLFERNPERIENLKSSFCKLARRQEAGVYSLLLCDIHPGAAEDGAILEDEANLFRSLAERFLAAEKLTGMTVSIRDCEIGVFLERSAKAGSVLEAEQGSMFRIARLWSAFLQEKAGFPVTIAVNEQIAELTDLAHLYERSKSVLADQFYVGEGTVISGSENRTALHDELMPPFPADRWLEAVNQLDRETVRELVHEYMSGLIRLRAGRKAVCDWAIQLIGRLEEEILHQSAGGYERGELYYSVYNVRTIQQIEVMVLKAAGETMERLGERFMDKNAKLVHQVCTLIDQTYHEPITINSLSDQVYLSPNYLRSIFKEKTGMTIHDYLTKIRLDKAKQLLADGSLKVQDIARKVGYESTSYFISLFLKNQGVTPNEYRKNL
ncbi:two-component system response regulator [Paenibacillus yonginensis]|uniref:Two-component system response regulator n=1 Tax=Paenibacillus yonginensis TaxID=1462996 RepID=A0A1B1MYR9_9BACL|nr:response regulator [Paenibacillus yonginensis]ANS74330.1 two-component system response regulator [Paenibacillus yonginensis]